MFYKFSSQDQNIKIEIALSFLKHRTFKTIAKTVSDVRVQFTKKWNESILREINLD
jgi:hypothetical protein